jgi:flagellar hook-associated protein 1
MGITSAMNAARSGLTAASLGIETTSNNVANASTEGYSRRAVRTKGGMAVTMGGNARGTGVAIDRVARATDWFVTKRVVETAGDVGEAQTRRDALALAESWFSEGEVNGISSRLQSFYDTLTTATTDPGNMSARRAVLTEADRFAEGVTRIAGSLVDIQTELEERAEDLASSVNARLEEVAGLNSRILEAGDPDAASDLIDRRDQVARSLAEDIGAELRIDRQTGEASVLLSGMALVQEGEFMTVQAGENDDGELTLLVGKGELDLGDDAGGRLGGMVKAWEKVEGYLDDLDSLVGDLGDALNTAHQSGYDLSGTAGDELFTWDTTIEHAATSFALNTDVTAEKLAFAGDSNGSVGDVTNLKVMLDVEEAELFSSQTAEQFMNSLVSEVGTDVNEAEADLLHYGAVMSDMDALRDSVAGVDLDEEAADLIKYQTAYQAAAKVMSVADELIATLLQVV